ncbi:hypothetical protein C8F04DRAFT_1266892 [Mycena alexandri]|uniref:Uncharacterized protein n=1 Tax=Mycena alexandri TaxID=1745969 RepID=A0AAD6SIA5_9AGAR|nr:hypothetical protein C8F04DRAFT_1266892 [Mycena alexandri]
MAKHQKLIPSIGGDETGVEWKTQLEADPDPNESGNLMTPISAMKMQILRDSFENLRNYKGVQGEETPRATPHMPDSTRLILRTRTADIQRPDIITVQAVLTAFTHARFNSVPSAGALRAHSSTGFFFWRPFSHADPPILTSLAIPARGPNGTHEFTPLETYLHRFGPRIHSLSFAYSPIERVCNGWSLEGTRAFHARTLSYTPRLVPQMLFALAPDSVVPATLISLPSPHLASLEVGIFLRGANPLLVAPPLDWAAIDAVVATPQFGSLQWLSFINHVSKKSIVTGVDVPGECARYSRSR